MNVLEADHGNLSLLAGDVFLEIMKNEEFMKGKFVK